MEGIKIIGFDADDTLWLNDGYFREAEARFCGLMAPYASRDEASKLLYKIEVENLALYGYGAKSYLLSLIETALQLGRSALSSQVVSEILDIGRWLIERPVVLVDGAASVLELLRHRFLLLLVTKGDLLDQERKLKASGLQSLFHHIEIMSNKERADYEQLFSRLQIKPEEFLMVGNSLRSDVIPPLELGARAIHIPHATVWQHETLPATSHNYRYPVLHSLSELPSLLE